MAGSSSAPTASSRPAIHCPHLADRTTGHGNLPLDALALTVLAFAVQWLPEAWLPRLRDRFVALPTPVQGLLLVAVAVLVRAAAGTRVAGFIYQGF